MDAFDRNTNLKIIEQVRNLPVKSLDDYIKKILIPLNEQNPNFNNALYKDILYVLEGFDKEDEGDLVIENGSLVIEDGGIKLSGYRISLHALCVWLHTEHIESYINKNINVDAILKNLKSSKQELYRRENYTPTYKTQLDRIKDDLIKERMNNYDYNNLTNKSE